MSIFYLSYIILKKDETIESKQHKALETCEMIHSDFLLPNDKIFLSRPNILEHIEAKLKGIRGIQSVALTGIGGVGKTTLARQYAYAQNARVIWELNAETRDSLRDSFENLAYALAVTEEDKKLIKSLQSITATKEKEKEIIAFVRERLRLRSPWTLVYDNVEQYDDIQAYLPMNADQWGKGKIILTTRDSNICNNWHIQHAINIEALHPQEAFTLFSHIAAAALMKDKKQEDDAKSFLKHLPPFPLDISTAAYYLTATNITYENYLSRLSTQHQDFTRMQENILKDAGNYSKTRYNIIALSLQHLLKNHRDFKDLLLFMCLLDSQNIPQELLNTYKGGVLVDNFIYHLKKYSLITNEHLHKQGIATFSVHRSIQELSLHYLESASNLEAEKLSVQDLADAFDQYIEKIVEGRDILRMKLLIEHIKAFLRHEALLTGTSKGKLERGLGTLYSFIGHYDAAQEYLERSVATLRKHDNKQSPQIACALLYLGFVYKALGYYEKAKTVLEESLAIYTKYYPEDHAGRTKALLYLGGVHDSLGEYQKARYWFEKSLEVCNQHLPEDDLNVAWALANLGITNRELGCYEEAEQLLKKSLIIFRHHFPEKHVSIALVLTNLGSVYRELGCYEEAKNLTQKSLAIYREVAGDTNIRVAWSLTNLGNIYRSMGEYEKGKTFIEQGIAIYETTPLIKNERSVAWASAYLAMAHRDLGHYQIAKNLMQKSLMVYEKHYGKDHAKTADLFLHYSQILLLEGQIDKAESYVNKALAILQQNNHPEHYRALEILAELHLKKALQATEKGDHKAAQGFKQQAQNLFNQALEIIPNHFPASSPHVSRIQTKAQKN
jgi:NB-ARC domain.